MSLAQSAATQLSHHANRKHGIRNMPNAVPKEYSCGMSETGDATCSYVDVADIGAGTGPSSLM
jgi:hypothetical protein